jgi:hypothetical protein
MSASASQCASSDTCCAAQYPASSATHEVTDAEHIDWQVALRGAARELEQLRGGAGQGGGDRAHELEGR